MADNEIELVANIEADIEGAQTYINNLESMSSGSMIAATSFLTLGMMIKNINDQIKNIDTSKLSQLSKAKLLNVGDYYNSLQNGSRLTKKQVDFYNQFGNFITKNNDSKAKQLLAGLTDHTVTTSIEEKRNMSIEALGDLLLKNRKIRDDLTREFSEQKTDARKEDSRLKNEVREEAKTLLHSFNELQSTSRNQLVTVHTNRLEGLKSESRNQKLGISAAYNARINRLETDFNSKEKTYAQNKERAYWFAGYTKDMAEEKLLRSLKTQDGIKYANADAIKERIKEIEETNKDYKTVQDKLNLQDTNLAKLKALYNAKYGERLKQIAKEDDEGTASKRYANVLTEQVNRWKKIEQRYKESKANTKKGITDMSTFSEYAELQQLLTRYTEQTKEINKNFKSAIHSADLEYDKNVDPLKEELSKAIGRAVLQRDTVETKRKNKYRRGIIDTRAENNRELQAFDDQQYLAKSYLESIIKGAEFKNVQDIDQAYTVLKNAMQGYLDIQNDEVNATKNVTREKKAEVEANKKLAQEARKGRHRTGNSLRDVFREGLIREEDRYSYSYGLRGLAIRGLQKGWNKFSSMTGGKIPAEVMGVKDSAGNLIAGSGVNPATIAIAAGAATIKAVKEINRFDKIFTDAFKEIESLKTNLSVVYGSQGLADKTFSEISSYAVKSPFGIAQLTEMATLLRQSGVYSTDLLETLKMIGDTAGGNMGKMRSIATDYARIMAMGKANSRELRTFAAAGVPIYKILREQEGLSQSGLMAKTRKGEISAEAIEKAFERMTKKGGVFYNAVNINADTLMAREQNLQDEIQLIKARIGERSNFAGWKEFAMGAKRLGWEIIDASSDMPSLYEIIRGGIKKHLFKKKNKLYNQGYINASALDDEELTESYEKAYLNNYRKLKSIKDSEEQAEYLRQIEVKSYEIEKAKKELQKDLPKSELDAIEKRIDKLKEELKSLKPDYYYRRKSEISLQEVSDFFEKQKEKEFSSTSMSFAEEEMFNKTAWGKLEEVKKEEKNLARIEELLGLQSKYGIGKYDDFLKKELDDFTWLQSAYDEKGRPKPNMFRSAKEVSDLFTTFYSGEVLDLKADKIDDKTMSQLSNNLLNLGYLKDTNINEITAAQWKEFESFTGALTDLKIKLKEAEGIKDKTDISEQIKKEIGKYSDWIDTIEDEAVKTIFKAALLDPSAQKVDDKQIEAIKKHNHKVYAQLWERYAVKTLGVSLDGMIEGRSVLSQFTENQSRTMATNLATAMLKENYNVDQALNRNLAYGANGLNLDISRRNLELGAIGSRASVSLTQAYLSTLQSSIDTMASFLGGMPFTAEDADKLYDPTWAHKMGYSDKGEFVSAFTNATKEGGEALEVFNTRLKGSISSILEETKKRKENVSQIVKAKQTSESMQTKVYAAKTDALAYELFSNGGVGPAYKTSNLNGLNAAITYLREALGKNGQLADDETIKKFLNKSLNTGGAYSPIKTPEKTGIIKQYATVEDYLNYKASSEDSAKFYRQSSKEMRLLLTPEVEAKYRQEYEDELSKYKAKVDDTKDKNKAYAEANEAEFQMQTATINLLNGTIEIDKIQEGLKYRQALDSARVYDERSGKYQPLATRKVNADGTEVKGYFSEGTGLMKYWGASELHPSIYSIEGGKSNSRAEQIALNHLMGGNVSELMEDFVTKTFTNSNGEFNTDEANKIYNQYVTSRKGNMPTFNWNDKTTIEEKKTDLAEMITLMENGKAKAEVFFNIAEDFRQSVSSTLSSTLTDGFTGTLSTLGKVSASLMDAADAGKELEKNFKSLMQTMSASIGDAMVQAGLQTVINAGKDGTKWAAGLAMIAAGGGLSFISGMMDDSDKDDDKDKDYERLQKIKEDLTALLRQAREDSIYYENTTRHKKAISTTAELSGTRVNDAIISPNGNVITTSPRDYLIATTNPHSLARGGSPNVNINFIDKSTGVVLKNQTASFDERTNTLNLEAVIESKMADFIASDRSDMAFQTRQQRQNGYSYVG